MTQSKQFSDRLRLPKHGGDEDRGKGRKGCIQVNIPDCHVNL